MHVAQVCTVVQIERICRRQIKCCINGGVCLLWGIEYCYEIRNAGYQHILLFPQCFQKVSLS